MTFAALQTIHSLLENEKYKAEKVLECAQYSYFEEYDQKEEELGSRAKAEKAMIGRAVTANYDNARSDLNRITDALQEFNSHDWR
jgi:hypothetical protein